MVQLGILNYFPFLQIIALLHCQIRLSVVINSVESMAEYGFCHNLRQRQSSA